MTPPPRSPHGEQLLRDGADILDVGGEATNPRAAPIDAAEELRRVLPGRHRARCAWRDRGQYRSTRRRPRSPRIFRGRAAAERGHRQRHARAAGSTPRWAPRSPRPTPCGHRRPPAHGRTQLAEVFAGDAAEGLDVAKRSRPSPRRRSPPSRPPCLPRTWVDPGLGFGKGADPEGEPRADPATSATSGPCARPRLVVVGPSRKRFLEAPARRRADHRGSRRRIRGRMPRGRPSGRARASRSQRRLAPPRTDRVHQVVGRAFRGASRIR